MWCVKSVQSLIDEAIIDIAAPLDIYVHDHIIVGRAGHTSLKGNETESKLLNTGERYMPTDRLTPGLKTETVTIVDDKLVVKHMGGDGVLSTPSMIALMERASIQAVQDYLPEGHTTVGFEVHVKHFGATPKGKKLTVRAELIEVDARKLRFKVEAHDEDKRLAMAPIGAQSLPFSARADSVSTAIMNFAMPLWDVLHENIMVAATVAIGTFVFRPRQLIGYDRLRSQPV
jgi:predicted thioesterase